MADRHYRLHERTQPGMRLGRNVNHDPRSLAYRVLPTGTVKSAAWARDVPIFDQGNLGSCTGNAGTGVLGSDPLYGTLDSSVKTKLDEKYAVDLYSAATKIDSAYGTYPPDDTGSDGLSIAKVLKSRGLISGYQHVTSLAAAQTAIQAGAFIGGFNWYEGFDSPRASDALVTISGAVRGGHEFEIREYDAATDTWTAANSWGTGWGDAGYFRFSSATLTRLLDEQGDITTFVPTSQPAPTPTPGPGPDAAAKATLDHWATERHVGENAKAARAWKIFEGSLS